MIMVPAVLIESEPRSMLHVVAVGRGSSAEEWIELDDLDQLAHPPAVAEAIRRSVAEYRGSAARPAGRPDWFHPDWQTGVDAWIDGVLGGADVRRSGPSEVIKFWSLSAIVKVPVTGMDGRRRGLLQGRLPAVSRRARSHPVRGRHRAVSRCRTCSRWTPNGAGC